jgi:hypothetical protein
LKTKPTSFGGKKDANMKNNEQGTEQNAKPTTAVKKLAMRSTAAALLMALLGGCTFKYPAGEKTGEPIDPRLKGVWHLVEEKKREEAEMLISEVSASVYRMTFGELEFDAYHIDLDIPNVLQTKLVDPNDFPPYGIQVFAIKGDELHVDHLLIPDGMELKSRQAVRIYVEGALRSGNYPRHSYVFRRAAKMHAQADRVPSKTEVLEVAEHKGATEWAQRYRDARPISMAEFLKHVPAVRMHVRASPFITQHVPIEDLLDLVSGTVRSQGIKVDPQAPITLKVEMLWVTADWTTTQNGREIARSPLHSSSVTMHLFMTAPVYRNGEFYLTEFSPAGRAVYSVSTGEWNQSSIRREMRERLRLLIGEMRNNNRPRASLEMWRERVWSPENDGAKYAAYQAALLKDIRLDPTLAGMSDIRPPNILFEGDARRFLRSSATLEGQWTARLKRLGLREDPASRNEIRHHVVAAQEPINPVGRLFGPLGMHFVAMSTTAALWEHSVAFEFNENVVLMDALHSVHSGVDVKMPRKADLGELARRVQDAFLTEKFEEQMSGSPSRR